MSNEAVQAFVSLPASEVRSGLAGFLAGYVHPDAECARAEVERRVAAVTQAATPGQFESLLHCFRHLGDRFGLQHHHPLARQIAMAYVGPLVDEDSELDGLDRLDEAAEMLRAGRRVLLISNHLSYADAMATCILLERFGRRKVVDAMTAVAGPKVYNEPMRRLSVSAIRSIKVAQSTSVASDQPELSPREVARISRHCLSDASLAMDQGHTVLLYPEGTRSRSGRMQPFLKATARWLSLEGVVLLPLGLWGAENLYLIDDERMRRATVSGRFGPPVLASDLAGAEERLRDVICDRAADLIAALLPEAYRPESSA